MVPDGSAEMGVSNLSAKSEFEFGVPNRSAKSGVKPGYQIETGGAGGVAVIRQR